MWSQSRILEGEPMWYVKQKEQESKAEQVLRVELHVTTFGKQSKRNLVRHEKIECLSEALVRRRLSWSSWKKSVMNRLTWKPMYWLYRSQECVKPGGKDVQAGSARGHSRAVVLSLPNTAPLLWWPQPYCYFCCYFVTNFATVMNCNVNICVFW